MGVKIKSLKSSGKPLAKAMNQMEIIGCVDSTENGMIKFIDKLENIGLYPLYPTKIEIMQINVGKMCNQTCEHCHVDAGPDRKEIMTRETMSECLEALKKSNVSVVDLTGGAPEMNPNFLWFVEEIDKLGKQVIVRSNLTILVANKKYRTYPEFFKKHRVTVISSLPCYTADNTNKQRGDGVFSQSIEALKLLNEVGYGKKETGLELHLVYNPIGASLPPPQEKLKEDYKRELKNHFGIEFNELYTITNLPISRFLDYLMVSEKFDTYMHTLIDSFNPAAATGVMCRNTISISWDGKLYDCDFNQMLELQLESSAPQHIRDFDDKSLTAREIIVNQHCYGCTAGAGSSCQGAIA